ncbi:MAG: DUF2274 domain-containing protein [Rhizobiaceae bacterium]
MAPLKLGKQPDRKTTKITFTASAYLNALPVDNADAYEAVYEQQESVENIIPHMLKALIKADRGFKRKVANSEITRETEPLNKHSNDSQQSKLLRIFYLTRKLSPDFKNL